MTVTKNKRLSIEHDFLQGISNLQEVETGYYCSNIRNDDIVKQDSNQYNTLQEHLGAAICPSYAAICPSYAAAALNFEKDLFSIEDGLDEVMNFQQYTTNETVPEPISTVH